MEKKLHANSVHFESFQHWVTQWKNLKDIPSVRVFVMITWKSSTTPTNELDSNALELKYWVCGKDSLMGAGIFIK